MTAALARARAAGLPLDGIGGQVRVRTSTGAYLSDGDRLRFAIHGADQPPTPASIQVDIELLADPRILVETTPFRIDQGTLSCAGLRLDVAAATPWWPPPPPRGRPDPKGAVNGLTVGPPWLPLAPRLRSDPGEGRVQGLGSRLDTVLDALTRCGAHPAGADRGHPTAVGRLGLALDRLVGFGPGLTPAGDDALVGVLAVHHRLADDPGWSRLGVRALAPALACRLAQTTEVSRLVLEHALDGSFAAAVLGAVDHLVWPAPAEVVAAACSELLGLGASSGADTLLGITCALHRRAQAASRRPGS